jgi:predicted dehydrogenase
MTNVRAGVIGVGYLGQFHAEKYAADPEVELVGIVDPDAARASQLARKLDTQAFTDPTHLMGNVDAVSIVVPTVLHHRIAKQFLEQGIHVLLEKPMTVTIEQADELIELASGRGLILQVGHIERFNPALTAIKPLIRTPRYLTAERSAPFTVRCTDVNVVLDLMIHDLDIVMDIAGSVPQDISAVGVSIITKEIDIASARIIFRDGCVADITASRVSDEKKRLLRVFEDEAIYTSDFNAQTASVSHKLTGSIPQVITKDISSDRRDTLHDEIRTFVRCVQNGARPLVSGVEGRRALALARIITRNIEAKRNGFIPVADELTAKP